MTTGYCIGSMLIECPEFIHEMVNVCPSPEVR